MVLQPSPHPRPVTEPGVLVKNLVLACIQSWVNRYCREEIVKHVSDNFTDFEIWNSFKTMYNCLGLDNPKARRNNSKQVPVKVWAGEIYDLMMKDENEDRVPEFAVSSQELQRVPLSLMSGANDVVPVCTRISTLENRMEKMMDEVSMFTMGKVLSPQYPHVSASYGSAAAVEVNGVQPPSTPRYDGQTDSTASEFAEDVVSELINRDSDSTNSLAAIEANYENLNLNEYEEQDTESLMFTLTTPEDLLQFVRNDKDKTPGKLNFSCSICSKRFGSRVATRNHVESIHFPGKFKYNCDYCEKELNSKSSLNYHVTTAHKMIVK